MDQITSGENSVDRRDANRALVPEANRPLKPYGTDPHVYPYFPQVQEQVGFDFYRYLRIALKYRWLIAGTTVAFVIFAAIFTLLQTPIYRATATIQIDREPMNVVQVGQLNSKDWESGQEFYQTQYELLASRSLAERVATTLGLADDQQFNQETRPSLFGMIRNLIFGTIESFRSTANHAGETSPGGTQAELSDRLQQATDRLRGSLQIAPVQRSRVVKITISHPHPSVAQTLANGYADVFIADTLDRRYEASSYARKFLEERLEQLKVKLEDSEKQLVKYAQEQGIINFGEKRESLADADLAAINSKLAEARNERLKKELLWKQVEASNGIGLKEILDSEAFQGNQKLRTTLTAEYQQKIVLYKPAYPAMVQLRNQIEELDRQMELQIYAIKDSIKAAYEGARKQEDLLAKQLESTKSAMLDQRSRSIEYNILQREVDTNRTLYDGLLQRYKEIGVAGGVGTNNVSIVDRATLPQSPSSPRLRRTLVLALLFGLAIGAFAALGLDYIDDSFKTPEDIEREMGVSVIGIVPLPRLGRSIEVELADPQSGIAEAYRSLRTALQFATSEGLPKSLLVTSSKPAEGKSTTSLSLARSFANIGLNVLLIDADLRNSSLHRKIKCSNDIGLSNYLTGAVAAENAVQETDISTLAFMASGPLPPNPAELLSGPRFMSLLSLAGQAFDMVIVDGPPVMGLADAPLLASTIQSTLLVVAAQDTRRNVLKTALRRLQLARANLIGTTLNKFNARQAAYGYGYGYGEYDYHLYGAKQIPSPKG